MHKKFLACLLGLSLSVGLGCRSSNNSDALADVDGTVITRTEVDRVAGKSLSNLRQQLYQLERQKLDDYIGATLLTKEAKIRNVSVSTLLDQEVNDKVPPISDEQIRNFYESNKDRLRVDLDKIRDQIRAYLREEKINAQKTQFLNTLRSKAKITTYLKPPLIQRTEMSTNDAPFKGAAKAPITIVKFEDFECPFCKSVQPTLTAVLKQYDGKVRLVHKDLPIESIHSQAQLAAQAARCAAEQGKFWEYHDTLYGNAPKLGLNELKIYANNVGLNAGPFEQCLSSGKYKGLVQKDLSEGAQLGITGTPTFFINGREISGAQPLEAFAAIIDEELGQTK